MTSLHPQRLSSRPRRTMRELVYALSTARRRRVRMTLAIVRAWPKP